ncbi:MAG TPA: L-threonylcarbamoyladenylate synthase [Burkholderiales bacterium]|nr:L-threonylcarbamoyladenylate synthase [Burkholderiales bacterium]
MSAIAPDAEIQRAVQVLRAGALVAFPTETVYGLGADASNAAAVRRIFEVKGRPADHPLIVHLKGAQDLRLWSRDAPIAAQKLAERFWPGPLTLILMRAPGVIDEITGGQDTVGLRVPSHPVAQQLLQAFGGGIAAPSANRFGRISPTSAQHVREELGDAVELVLDGGACEVGIESTILDLSSGHPVLLRPGRIGAAEIELAIGVPVARPGAHAPRASGMLAAHYAPSAPMILAAAADLDRVVREQSLRVPVAVLARRARPSDSRATLWQGAATDAQGYAHDLYALLRLLDRSGCGVIVVELPPERPEWEAVRDRLMRAAAGSGGAVAGASGSLEADDAT